MELGYHSFLKRALLALGTYTALSAATYALEGELAHWFFNPAVNNFLIGSFVLFAFAISAGKRLESLPWFAVNRKELLACLVVALLLFGARTGFEESLARKAISTAAGLVLVTGFLGRKLSVHLAKNYSNYVVPGILCFYIIDYVFDWDFLAMPVLSVLVSALRSLGVQAFVNPAVTPPALNVFNVSVQAVDETSGVDALILYSIVFLGLAAWQGKRFRLRVLTKRYFLGLAGGFGLMLVRLFALVALFGFLDTGFVNALALSPLNQLLFVAYPVAFWRKSEKGLGA